MARNNIVSEPESTDGNRQGPKVPFCQVQSCGVNLQMEKLYYQRYRVCPKHLKMPSLQVDGKPCRFCQLCGHFQDVTDFDEDKRSCRVQLLKHNQRRRKVAGTAVPVSRTKLCITEVAPGYRQGIPRIQEHPPTAEEGRDGGGAHNGGGIGHHHHHGASYTSGGGNGGGGGGGRNNGGSHDSGGGGGSMHVREGPNGGGSGQNGQNGLHTSAPAPPAPRPVTSGNGHHAGRDPHPHHPAKGDVPPGLNGGGGGGGGAFATGRLVTGAVGPTNGKAGHLWDVLLAGSPGAGGLQRDSTPWPAAAVAAAAAAAGGPQQQLQLLQQQWGAPAPQPLPGGSSGPTAAMVAALQALGRGQEVQGFGGGGAALTAAAKPAPTRAAPTPVSTLRPSAPSSQTTLATLTLHTAASSRTPRPARTPASATAAAAPAAQPSSTFPVTAPIPRPALSSARAAPPSSSAASIPFSTAARQAARLAAPAAGAPPALRAVKPTPATTSAPAAPAAVKPATTPPGTPHAAVAPPQASAAAATSHVRLQRAAPTQSAQKRASLVTIAVRMRGGGGCGE